MLASLFRFSRLGQLLRRVRATRQPRRRTRGWFGLGDAIRIEATDRADGWASCQLEELEQRKVLDADFNLTGTTLTITLDSDSQEVSFVSL